MLGTLDNARAEDLYAELGPEEREPPTHDSDGVMLPPEVCRRTLCDSYGGP